MNRAAALAMVLVAVLWLPSPAQGQGENKLIPTAVGAVTGIGAGGFVALGVVAYRARQGRYLFGVEDAFGWESAAVLAGGGTGVVLGLWDPRRLRNTIAATAGLGLVGSGVGALIGRAVWPPPEGKWAGAVIGGGAGILLGAVVGVLLPPDQLWSDETKTGIPLLVRVPVGR